jgi:hypothetical protein
VVAKAKKPAKALKIGAKGAILFCLRDMAIIAARLPNGKVIPVVTNDGLGASPLLKNPYGIAWDSAQRRFWVADKGQSAVWQFHVDIETLRFTNAVALDLGSFHAPCMLDWHPKFGLLAGCFGVPGAPGAVALYDGGSWRNLMPPEFKGAVTHCCWLPNGGFCFISRSDCVLWVAEGPGVQPSPRTIPGKARRLSPVSGSLRQLLLRYVQGLCFSKRRNAILVADASLGAIYEVNLNDGKYALLAGKPLLSDSFSQANLQSGRADVWLGPIRAIAEDSEGRVLFLDGETGRLLRVSAGGLEILGNALLENHSGRVAGTGMLVI